MPTRIWMTEIFEMVAKRYGMTAAELCGPRSTREYAEPRQVAVYLCRQLTSASYPAIGERVHQHHSTIFYSMQVVVAKRVKNSAFDALVESIVADLEKLRAA